MENSFHGFSELFAQLGLEHSDAAIQSFIKHHAPLAANVRLDEAGFWTPAQSRLLRESLLDDADWAPVVDRLNVALRRM